MTIILMIVLNATVYFEVSTDAYWITLYAQFFITLQWPFYFIKAIYITFWCNFMLLSDVMALWVHPFLLFRVIVLSSEWYLKVRIDHAVCITAETYLIDS